MATIKNFSTFYTDQSRLGRIPSFDQRNLKFLIADYVVGNEPPTGKSEVETFDIHDPSLIKKLAILTSRGWSVEQLQGESVVSISAQVKYFWDSAWWGDQGDTSECTAYAAMHAMADGSVTHKTNPLVEPGQFYNEIVSIDRQENRYYTEGATSLAMAKALARRNFIGEYLWGYSLSDFIKAIRVGPVLIGIDWYTGMDNPDSTNAIIRATGRIRGGHEIVANGCSFSDGLVRLKQSWGRSFGRRGHVYLPFEDLEKLIADGGDVCMFRELKLAA